jgi:acylphosphatase
MDKQLECFISGRVQLVMYRDFARREARRLDLSGYVENLADGRVHAVAEGQEGALSDFLSSLRRGSPLARVEQVEARWAPATGAFDGFVIRYRNILDRI